MADFTALDAAIRARLGDLDNTRYEGACIRVANTLGVRH